MYWSFISEVARKTKNRRLNVVFLVSFTRSFAVMKTFVSFVSLRTPELPVFPNFLTKPDSLKDNFKILVAERLKIYSKHILSQPVTKI